MKPVFYFSLLIFFFASCKKETNKDTSLAPTRYTTRQLDSIAGIFGFKRDTGQVDSSKSMTVERFLEVMNQTKTSRSNAKISDDVEVIEETAFQDYDNPNYWDEVTNVHTRHITYPNLRAMLFPSIYSFTVLSDGTTVSFLGSAFEYAGLGSNVPEIVWNYSPTGGAASGIAQDFNIGAYGVATERIVLFSGNYTKVYAVQFSATNVNIVQNAMNTKIKLTRLN